MLILVQGRLALFRWKLTLNAPICSMGRELLPMSLAGDAPSGILAAGKQEPKQVLPSPDGVIP